MALCLTFSHQQFILFYFILFFFFLAIHFRVLHEVGDESAYNAGDLGLIPGLGRSPVEGNSNPLQYSCLENLVDRGDWQAT